MNITLDRIVALIKKLEDEHPETHNMLRIQMYDDFSGRFVYVDFDNSTEIPVVLFGVDNSLEDLMQKYRV